MPQNQVSKESFLRIAKFFAWPVLLAVVPTFLLFSQQQLKDSAERFLSDCLFVLDKERAQNGQILLTARLTGTVPKALPLVFEGDGAQINSIVFDDAFREGSESDPTDLGFHPLTGSVCPGPLCPEAGPSPDRLIFPITVTDLHRDFVYRFRVRVKTFEDKPLTANHLKVYAIFDHGLSGGFCRIQPLKWWNFWAWASGLQKFSLFAVVVILCSGLLWLARR